MLKADKKTDLGEGLIMVTHVHFALSTLTLLGSAVRNLYPVQRDWLAPVFCGIRDVPAFSAINLVMLPHKCSLFLLVAELYECIAAIPVLAFLHLNHRQVALVLEVVLDLLFGGGRLHPKQDHIATVGVIFISNTFCLKKPRV